MIFLPLQTGLLLLIISHTSALHRKLNDCQDIQKLLFHQKDSTNCLPAEATKCSEATLREKMKNRLKEFLKGEYQLIRLSLEAESTRFVLQSINIQYN
jgi:adenosine deaminase